MRLKDFFKKLCIFGLILFLGVTCPAFNTATAAYAGETREIKLNVNSQTLVRGTYFTIRVYNLTEGQTVTYRSTASSIASVDENGVVYANMIGSATILVTVTEGDSVVASLPCKVTIGPPAISLVLCKLDLKLVVGQDYMLKYIVQPLISTEVPAFSSFNKNIAKVSAGGRVSAKAEGKTYIFAQIDNGKYAVCTVNVYPEGTVLEPTSESEVDDPRLLAEGAFADSTDSTTGDTGVKREITDPLLADLDSIDFETFIKRLIANGIPADNAEIITGDTVMPTN